MSVFFCLSRISLGAILSKKKSQKNGGSRKKDKNGGITIKVSIEEINIYMCVCVSTYI